MIEPIFRGLGIEPHIGLAAGAKRAFTLDPSGGYDERKLVDGRGAVAGLPDETLVLRIRDRMNRNQEIVEMDSVCRSLVCVCIVGPHQKITRGDQCEFRQQVSRHARDEVHRIASLL